MHFGDLLIYIEMMSLYGFLTIVPFYGLYAIRLWCCYVLSCNVISVDMILMEPVCVC